MVNVWGGEGIRALFNNFCKFDTKLYINLFIKLTNGVFGENKSWGSAKLKKLVRIPRGEEILNF